MSTSTETDHPAAAPCRALVPTTPHQGFGSEDRPRASFITQLIASRCRLPAYRRTGRTDPGSAATIYGAGKIGVRASLNVLI